MHRACRSDLTDREVEVRRLVADACTDREIATELFISRKTASMHVSSILRKVQATNRLEAAAIASEVATRRTDRGGGGRLEGRLGITSRGSER